MSGLEASLLFGGVHSVLLAVALGRRRHNRRANRYLVAQLVALALLLFDGFLSARGTLISHPHLIGLAAWVPWVLGPLVFLYVREMTATDPAHLQPAWRHLVAPAVYVVMLAVVFYPRSASYKLGVAQHEASWVVLAFEVILITYGIAYSIGALALLRRHRGHVQALYSNLRDVGLRWLSILAVLNALVWVAAFVSFAIRITGVVDSSAASAIVPIGSTITVFVIGYFQLGQVEIFAGQPAVEALSPQPDRRTPAAEPLPTLDADPTSSPAAVATDVAEPTASPAYARARLADEDAAALEARIRAAMTEGHLYQRAGLTLAELADEVAATPHEVSQVLSTRLQRNFYNFVNEHRIEHVKTGLRTTDRPVLDLAFEAGFQSKSTFNSAFRKATGTTPREFRQGATS